jgi:WD40 repeat protein
LKIEEALQVIDKALEPIALSDIQERVLRGVWEGHTYEKIAEHTNYESEYIKHIGYQLWQRLSQLFGEKVTKGNLQSVLRRQASQIQELAASLDTSETDTQNKNDQSERSKIFSPESNLQDITFHKRCDWGEAINITAFYGRTDEVALLQQWVLEDHCQLVALLGMGGIGKTALARKFVEQIQDQFDCLIWRSLRQAPPLDEILTAILKSVTPDQELHLPESEERKLARLVESLQASRCLLILDNMESILWGGDSDDVTTRQRAGHYRKGYEGYGELLKYIGESSHQSCLVLTSREKPKEIAALESQKSPVRSLVIRGLPTTDARYILQIKQIEGSDENCDRLIQRYAGNPLALKIVTSTIQELFDGDVAEFLQEGIAFFGDIGELLDEQFNRLSPLEKQIMFWIAVNQEPISLTDLNEDNVFFVSKRELLEALESLGRRPLIEKMGNRFSHQPVVMEYMTDKIIEQVFQELVTKELYLIESHPLLKAIAKDYIREGQTRLILEPIIEKLKAHFKSIKLVEIQLKQVLNTLQEGSSSGYSAGNLINLLCQLKVDFEGYDFSRLMIRHAYLRNIDLHHTNFSYANFDSAVFTETFGGILSISMSSDGRFLATGGTDSTVRLWQVADEKQLWVGKHLNLVWSVAFSPDNLSVFSGSADSAIRIWDVATGECLRTLHNSFDDIHSIALSPSGDCFIVGDTTKQYTDLLDIKTGSCLKTFKGHTKKCLWAVAFSPDGSSIATGGADTTIKVWDIETGTCLITLVGHQGWIRDIAFHPSVQMLASTSNDNTIKLWNLDTGECLNTLMSHIGIVSGAVFSPDGAILATSSSDCTIKLWHVSSGQCFQTLQGHASTVWTITFSSDGTLLVSGGDDHRIKFWDVQTGQCIKTWQGHSNAIIAVNYVPKFFRENRLSNISKGTRTHNPEITDLVQTCEWLLASGSEDQIIRFWEMQSQQCCATLVGHKDRIMAFALSPDGHTLFSGSSDRSAKLWNIHTGECLKTFYGHTSWIWSVAYASDARILATAGVDETVRLWSMDGQCLKILQEHQGIVYALAFSPDATTLVSGGLDHALRFWNVSHGNESFMTLNEHTGGISDLIFSSDGDHLVSSSKDKTIKIWNSATGQCIKTLEGHGGSVWSIAISPDDRLLASGGEDRTLRIWDFESGECLKIMTGHENMIKSVTFHPEEPIVVSGSLDETMKVWDINTGECLQTLRVERPYEGMNITGTTGLTEAQKGTLKALGAVNVNVV